MYKLRSTSLWLLLIILAAACAPAPAAVRVVEIADEPLQPTAPIIFITPTRQPTLPPTAVIGTPTLTVTPRPSATPTVDGARRAAQCEAVLMRLYEDAGELCLGKPSGFFCNGGLPPVTSGPAARIQTAFSATGALIPAEVVDWVQTAPLLAENSGGLLWLHLAEAIRMNALLIGDVTLTDVTPLDLGFNKWQSFTVVTNPPDRSLCPTLPKSSFVVQGPYGQPTRLVINGVSVDLNGTMAIQTENDDTVFIALEGTAQLIVYGQARPLIPGQQVTVVDRDGDFRVPAAIPDEAIPLDRSRIVNMPVAILDRPVELPQPGYVQTDGAVNMRAEASASSRLLFQVPAGEVMSVLGTNSDGDWYHIRLGNGDTGWMRADLLRDFTGQIAASYDATPLPPQRFGELGTSARVSASSANLRSAPDVGFPVLTTLPAGTELTLLQRSPYSPWVKVDAGGGLIGWLALITIETQSAVAFLPVDYEVPLPPRPTATPYFAYGGGHAYPDPLGGQ